MNLKQKIVTAAALIALLILSAQDYQHTETKTTFYPGIRGSSRYDEKINVTDYRPLGIGLFVAVCCYIGLMFVFKTPNQVEKR